MQMSMFLAAIIAKFEIKWAGADEESMGIIHAWLLEVSNVKIRFLRRDIQDG